MPLDSDDWALGKQDRDQNTTASLVITVVAVTVGLVFVVGWILLLLVGF